MSNGDLTPMETVTCPSTMEIDASSVQYTGLYRNRQDNLGVARCSGISDLLVLVSTTLIRPLRILQNRSHTFSESGLIILIAPRSLLVCGNHCRLTRSGKLSRS